MIKHFGWVLCLSFFTTPVCSEDATVEAAHQAMADKLYAKGSIPFLEVASRDGYLLAETESALRVMFDGFARCSIDFMAARPEPEFRTVLELTAKDAPQDDFVEALGPWVDSMIEILDEHREELIACTEPIQKEFSIQFESLVATEDENRNR